MGFSLPLGNLLIRLLGDSTSFDRMVDASVKKINDATKKMDKAGRFLTLRVTLPILGVGTAAVKSFSDFDDAMTKSIAIMSGVTDDVRKQMEAQARAISGRSITSVKDLAEAYFFLASAGLNAQQSIGDTTHNRNGFRHCVVEVRE